MKEREIKFRVWEYEAEEFLYLDPNKEDFDSKWLKNDEQSVCQQYTGLKDKKGKEIYEGDIILEDQFVEWINKEDARFDQEYGCYGIQNGKYNLIAYSEDEDFEVIGNIYENRDLLK